MREYPSDIAFTPAVKAIQAATSASTAWASIRPGPVPEDLAQDVMARR